MADLLAEFEGGLGSQLSILGGGGDSQRIARAADDLAVGGLLSVHHGEERDLGVGDLVVDLAAVPGAVLIEGGLAGDEVGLDLVVAQSDAGGIKVTLVDHILEGVHSGGDGGIVPAAAAGEDIVQGLVADGLLNDRLQILGDAPGLLAGAAEGNDALLNEGVAAGDQVLIGLGDMVPAGLAQQIHVGEEGNDVVGQGDGIVMSVIGGVLQHHFGQLIGEGLIGLIHAVDRAGLDEVAQESAGPGEEDVGQGFGIAHGSLDLGLVGLVLKGLPFDLDIGVRSLEGGNGLLVGGTVGIALGGDAPHGQRGLIIGRGHGSAQRNDHDKSQNECEQFFHVCSSLKKIM